MMMKNGVTVALLTTNMEILFNKTLGIQNEMFLVELFVERSSSRSTDGTRPLAIAALALLCFRQNGKRENSEIQHHFFDHSLNQREPNSERKKEKNKYNKALCSEIVILAVLLLLQGSALPLLFADLFARFLSLSL